MGKKRAPWKQIKDDYILSETPVSLDTLSKKYNLYNSTVYKRSADENWVQQRGEYWDEVARKTRALAASKKSNEKVTQLEQVESAFSGLVASISAINDRIQKTDFAEKVDKIKVAQLMERQASLNNALDKVGRLIQLLQGNADSRQAVDLAALLTQDPSKPEK